MSGNKFITPAGQLPGQPQKSTPQRPMIQELPSQTASKVGSGQRKEVVESRTFEFPPRGSQASDSATPVATPTTVTPELTKTYAETNPDYTSVDLPSMFQFYSFRTLAVRTLLGAHIAKFSRGRKEGRLRYIVEGISATLEPGVSAFDLTPGDFYFLMYWQRVQSFNKNPMIITAYCTDEKHISKVLHGYEVDDPDNPGQKKTVKLGEDTLRTEQILHNTTLDVKYADLVDVSDLEITSRYNLGVETMRDVVECTEMLQFADEPLGEDQLFLMQNGAFLKTAPGQATLKEKMAIVERMTPDDLQELEVYKDRVTHYGVSEYAMIKCKECSASTKVKLPIDALTFLPSGR